MAAHSKIAKLSARIDVLAGRRVGRLSMDMLTVEAWAKIERLSGGQWRDMQCSTGCGHLTDEAILRFLVENGCLDEWDFREGAVRTPQ